MGTFEHLPRHADSRARTVRIDKPVLNWANVCSPNIPRTVRRTMTRFLIELLVRRTRFGQFDELRSQLACTEMQASGVKLSLTGTADGLGCV